MLSMRFPFSAALACVAVLGPTRAACLALALSVLAALSWLALRLWLSAPRKEDTIVFFHPNAAGGGGGERVLWCAVSALQKRLPRAKIAVMCDERLTAASLRRSAKETFGVDLERDVDFVVPLRDVARLEPRRHPRLTLVSQSLAGALLALEGLKECSRCRGGSSGNGNSGGSGGDGNSGGGNGGAGTVGGTPALFVDTSGWPLSFLVAKAAGCDVAAYVHYPIVSSDMLARVKSGGGGSGGGGGKKGEERQQQQQQEKKKKSTFAVAGGGDNSSSSSPSSSSSFSFAGRVRSAAKTAYYHLVASLYGACGGIFCDVAVANSSWTAGHLEALWWRAPFRKAAKGKAASPTSAPPFASSTVVYPPCGASSLAGLPLERAPLPEEFFGPGSTDKNNNSNDEKKVKNDDGRRQLLVALAQFRPEKNQAALLRAFALARRRAAAAAADAEKSSSPSKHSSDPSSPSNPSHPVLSSRLALVGGVRDAADAARVEELRSLARELGLVSARKKRDGFDGNDNAETETETDETETENGDDAVVFVTNAPRDALRRLLSSATGGLHAMVDEHFGICVVEYMSAGVVPIAHGSAGPKMDIVVDEEVEDEGEEEETEKRKAPPPPPPRRRRLIPTGFLCTTEEEYANAITRLLLLACEERGGEGSATAAAGGADAAAAVAADATDETSRPSTSSPPLHFSALEMAAAARRRALRLFDDAAFIDGFVEALGPLLSRVERGCRREKEEEREKKNKKKS